MKLWIVIAALLVLPWAAAQDSNKQEIAGGVTKVFKLNYANVDAVYSALNAFDVKMAFDRNLQILSVRGSDEAVSAVGAAIKDIDVPAAATRNVELTFHVLLAQRGAGSPDDSSLPDELEGVAVQLKDVLGFTGVTLLESAVIRVRDNSPASTSGVLGGVGAAPATYKLSLSAASVVGHAEDTAVRLRRLEFSTRVAMGDPQTNLLYLDVGMNTDVDVKAGQKAVVGSAGVDGQGRTLILVVAARTV